MEGECGRVCVEGVCEGGVCEGGGVWRRVCVEGVWRRVCGR